MCCLGAWPDCKLLFVPKVKSLFLGLIISPKEGCNDLVSRFFFPALFFFLPDVFIGLQQRHRHPQGNGLIIFVNYMALSEASGGSFDLDRKNGGNS